MVVPKSNMSLVSFLTSDFQREGGDLIPASLTISQRRGHQVVVVVHQPLGLAQLALDQAQ